MTRSVGQRRRAPSRWWWAVAKYVLGPALAAVALWALAGHTAELSGAGSLLDRLNWSWIAPAVALEGASLVAFSGMQARLLAAGGVRAPRRSLVAMTLGSQAITNSLPGGTALATVYGFRWYRRFGADDAVAGWTLVGTMVGAIVSLAVLAAGGVVLSTNQGATLDLVPVVAGVLVVALAVGALFVYERPLTWLVARLLRASKRLTGYPRGDLARSIDAIVERVTVVRLDWRGAAGTLGWGLGTWVADGACFALSFLAIGAGIPWKGLLLAYGAGQLAANLPITPGGLGAVEGSITIALVAFGGARTSTVDAVLIYRLMSFWLVLAVGWIAAGTLAVGVRRGRWAVERLGIAPAAPLDPGLRAGRGGSQAGAATGVGAASAGGTGGGVPAEGLVVAVTDLARGPGVPAADPASDPGGTLGGAP